ncbi:MAG: cell division protein FtsZ [Cyclobacteriaceae bacterium]|nr:cell division protein FtsZ [Cyclobacteriaceae bacterium]
MFETSSFKFDLPVGHQKSIIKVIGVGGGGSNAVNHMYRLGIKDVEFVVANTDSQALHSSPVPTKLQLGANLTEGLGCGANPEVGRAAAMESRDQIREMLQGTKMVFVTAGMGGGTGTGAAPVIAKIAKELDILTVGIVTMPFDWEGRKKVAQAQAGVDAMRASCDTVLVILNGRLREMYGNLPISQAFAEADSVLTTAAKGIAEIITLAGYVNVDFQDVRTVMLNAGAAVMGSSETNGDDRAIRAAKQALASPLLDSKEIMGAKKILLSIISGEEAELQMDELSEITDYIQEQAGDECEVIFGHGVDPSLGDRIRVTVIATGFASDNRPVLRKPEVKKVMDLEKTTPVVNVIDNSINQRTEEIELRILPEPTVAPVKDRPILTPTEEKLPPSPGETDRPILNPEVKKPVVKPIEKPIEKKEVRKEVPPTEERTHTWTLFDQDKEDQSTTRTLSFEDEDGDEGLFVQDEDEFLAGREMAADQIINEEGEMELRQTKERLQQQAIERRERLKSARKQEMSKEEFNDKWNKPAYLRRGVKMDNVPHSSEPHLSRYNLNDDSNLLGNNKFLHDNVD